MKTKKRLLFNVLISILLIFSTLFASSCLYDPDTAVNIADCISHQAVKQEDSTVFYFYYDSQEHPIEDYELIKVGIEYYVDYNSWMQTKTFIIVVPDDVVYQDGQTYFTAKVNEVFTSQSIVYLSFLANYKTTKTTRFWPYFFSILIGLVMLFFFWWVYMVFCERLDSNTLIPSVLWFGGLVIYTIVNIIIYFNWGLGPCGIMAGSTILYFICTLFTYFQYKR